MPPKKGKKKKSGKKGKKSGVKSGNQSIQSTDVPKLSAENKSGFMIQVNDLEKQIELYQRKCDDLEVMNGMFEDNFTQTIIDKKDISEHLDILLRIRVDEITKLNAELSKLQELRDQEKTAFEEQIQQKRRDFDEIIDQLTSDKRIKSGQLASMEEFRVQKEDLMGRFAALQEEIRLLDETNTEDVYQMERATVVEMDRLKKEMIDRVNNVSAEFRKVSNRQMAETNRKTIRENVELSNQIKKKSERTMELINENDRLRSIESEHKRQIDISIAVEKELAKKEAISVKKIKYWIDECRKSEAEIAQFESEEHRSMGESIQTENKALVTELNEREEEHREMIENKNKLLMEKEILTSTISSSKESLKVHKKLVTRTKNALIDTENLMDPSEEYTEGEIIIRRQIMISRLLELLNQASVLGFGLEPRQLGKQQKLRLP